VAALAAGLGDSTTSTSPPGGGNGTGGSAVEASAGPVMTLPDYHVSPIAILLVLVYALSFALYKAGRMRLATHRKIWNLLLLATFLLTGVMGLFLAVRLTYALPFILPFNLLLWHVETGIAMTLISFFHVSWHLSYYTALFRRRRQRALRLETIRNREERYGERVYAEVGRSQQARRTDDRRERR
jgi:hypothetical protein